MGGDEVDSIRNVNSETQRSTNEIESVSIYPAREIVVTDDSIAGAIKSIKKDYDKTAKFFLIKAKGGSIAAVWKVTMKI